MSVSQLSLSCRPSKGPTLFHGLMSSHVQKHFDQTNLLTGECAGLTGGLNCSLVSGLWFGLMWSYRSVEDVQKGQLASSLTTQHVIPSRYGLLKHEVKEKERLGIRSGRSLPKDLGAKFKRGWVILPWV